MNHTPDLDDQARYRHEDAAHRAYIVDLVTPRTRTDAVWQADVEALVTPENEMQRAALHYAATAGVIPHRVHLTDGQRVPGRGFTGYVGLPEPPTLADHIATISDGEQLGIRLPANVIGIDIDTYIVNTTGGTVHKRGGRTITNLEARLGPLPATYWSSRREPLSNAPEHRTGIYFYRISERTLTYWHKRGTDYLTFRDLTDVEVISFGYRYAMVSPSTIDGLTYRWHAPTGEPIDVAELPDFATLPVLPDKWCAHLSRNPRTRKPRQLRTPGEPSGGGATYAQRAEDADNWCAENVAAWTDPPDTYLDTLTTRAIRKLATAPSRHRAARDGTTAILSAAVGSEEHPGHPGGQAAITALADSFLEAKPTPQALGDFNRGFAGAVEKIAAAIESGDLQPIPATTFRFAAKTTETSAQ